MSQRKVMRIQFVKGEEGGGSHTKSECVQYSSCKRREEKRTSPERGNYMCQFVGIKCIRKDLEEVNAYVYSPLSLLEFNS